MQEDDDYENDYKDKDKETTEAKPVKKKKVTSAFGLGFLGRFFNLFS